jgi:hypothetical protein
MRSICVVLYASPLKSPEGFASFPSDRECTCCSWPMEFSARRKTLPAGFYNSSNTSDSRRTVRLSG